MAKHCKITYEGGSFDAFYSPMATSEKKKPKIIGKIGNEIVSPAKKILGSGELLKAGMTANIYVDTNDKEVSKDAIEYFMEYGDELLPVDKVTQTRVFKGDQVDNEKVYTDEFIIEKFYEIYPYDGGHEKDVDRKVAVSANAQGMYELWQELYENNKVLRGEFNPATGGFITQYGYIRAVQFDGDKWGLEVGVFKERKKFKHLQDGEPQVIEASKKTKVSMI